MNYQERALVIIDRLTDSKAINIRERGTLRRAILLPERPQGEWIKVKENRMSIDMSGELVTRYKCSKCGRGIATLPSKLADYPFCHCGAEMKGGAE